MDKNEASLAALIELTQQLVEQNKAITAQNQTIMDQNRILTKILRMHSDLLNKHERAISKCSACRNYKAADKDADTERLNKFRTPKPKTPYNFKEQK